MADQNDLTAVESLLAERDAVVGWLARLDAAGSTAPVEVRDRVRIDYRARLDGLTERLRDHAEVVAGRLATDQAEHDALMARAREAREALAEVELRHMVGEFGSERFESERVRHVEALEQCEAQLGQVAERIASLEEVHALVSAPAAETPVVPVTPAVPPTAAAPEVEHQAPADPWADEAADASPEFTLDVDLAKGSAGGDDAPEPTPIDALAPAEPEDAEADTDALLSIFGGELGIEPSTTPPPRPALPAEEFGPLSFTPTGTERPPAPPVVQPTVPPIGMSGTEQRPRFVRPGERGGGTEMAGAAPTAKRVEAVRVIPDPEPILPEVPTDTGPDAVARTLRCGECGAMNRPLEWYCEKCGAELSAV